MVEIELEVEVHALLTLRHGNCSSEDSLGHERVGRSLIPLLSFTIQIHAKTRSLGQMIESVGTSLPKAPKCAESSICTESPKCDDSPKWAARLSGWVARLLG